METAKEFLKFIYINISSKLGRLMKPGWRWLNFPVLNKLLALLFDYGWDSNGRPLDLSQRTWSTIVFMLVCEQAPISGSLIIDVLARARVKLWDLELHESQKSASTRPPANLSPSGHKSSRGRINVCPAALVIVAWSQAIFLFLTIFGQQN